MTITINVNDLSLCHKGSDGWVHNTLPDVCKTPSKGIPLPYENEAYSRDLIKGTTTVFADGGNMIANLGSEFSVSIYDEPGSMGGVKSGTHLAEADWITHSFDVFFEGKPACRLTDKMFMNHRNTVSLGGEQQKDLNDDDFENEICEMACDCWNKHKSGGTAPLKSGETFQGCLDKKIKDKYYDGDYPKDGAPMWREVPFDRDSDWGMIGSKADPNIPTHGVIRQNSRRPDIVRRGSDAAMKKIYDVKFPTDPTGNGNMKQERLEEYQKIAERHTGDPGNYEEFNVKDRFNGCGNPVLVPVFVPVPAPGKVKDNSGSDYAILALLAISTVALAICPFDGPAGETAAGAGFLAKLSQMGLRGAQVAH